ncbi:hypothetical protein, partial [[Clostridium] symbiosum]|uniref:hypothetical protein n=1 Tax=Clostridium symbiosum TaxID=1512 RepID=UPI00321B1F75
AFNAVVSVFPSWQVTSKNLILRSPFCIANHYRSLHPVHESRLLEFVENRFVIQLNKITVILPEVCRFITNPGAVAYADELVGLLVDSLRV